MGAKVKGIVVELGGDATGLNKAIKSVTAEAKDTQSELKKIERLLKMDPTNVTLLKQKQELLNQSIEKTETAVKALKDAKAKADKDMENGTEVNEKAYRELERQIEANEMSLRKARQEADQVAKALDDIDSGEIRDVERAAEEAADALEEASDGATSFGDVLKANLIAEGATAIVGALKDVSEETKEYRKIMGSLKVSSEDAGYTAEQTAETYKQLYAVLADDQSAATATANLQAMHLEQDKLTEITNAAIGAWSRYGDSISIDSLAEAINHSAQLGEVQSSLADVLEWAGLSVDDFNAQLAECNSTSERADLILQMMADQGLTAAGEKWRETNASMVESNEASADLQAQLATLGETIEPVFTMLTQTLTSLLEWFNGLDCGTQNFILTTILLVAAIGPVVSALSGMSGAVSGVSSAISFLTSNPIVAVIAAVVGMVALFATKGDEIQSIMAKVDDYMQNVFATDWTETFGPVMGGVMNEFMDLLENAWNDGMDILNGVIDFIQAVFVGDWESAWSSAEDILTTVLDSILSTVGLTTDDIKSGFDDAISFVQDLLDFDWKWPKIPLPRFSWSGGFSLNPLSTPKLSVSWFAEGAVLKGAQLFGMLGEKALGAGEAGPEAVLPLSSFYKELRYVLEDILYGFPGMSILTAAGSVNSAAYHQSVNNNSTTNLGGVNIAIYGAPGQDVRELAEIVMDEMQHICDQKEVALA